MAFKILYTFLVKSSKLAIQKQFFISDFSSPTKSRLRKIVIQIPSVWTNLELLMHRAISSLMKNVITLLAILTFSCNALAVDFSNAKIAVVDVPSVLDNSVAVKHLRASIDKISEQFSKELSSKEIEFKQMEAALVKKRDTIKPELFDTEVEAFYKKLSVFQHETQKKKEKLERAHAEAIDLVHENTIKIVHAIAKEKKFNIAMPMSHTLYSDEAMNITAEVTSRLNHTLKEVALKF
jgi:Skp family chaperone for outer membrane proteins